MSTEGGIFASPHSWTITVARHRSYLISVVKLARAPPRVMVREKYQGVVGFVDSIYWIYLS